MSEQLKFEYETLRSGAGFVELMDRCWIRLTGEDRQAFFHNFCTNEIKKLEPGESCEAFVLNSKGKILGFVHAIALENELLLSGHGQQAESLIAHLDMYLIREDVELNDVTNEFCAFFVCGAEAKEKLQSLTVVPTENQFNEFQLGEAKCLIGNVELAGFGFMVACDKANHDQIQSAITALGISECSTDALEIVRIEQQTPWFGIDMDDSNLPQELQRDDKAINFNKGCYLGQETVARIDARGRVNNLLVGLKFSGDPPAVGDELMHDGKQAGRVTSAVQSCQDESTIGLGYVRRNFKEPGSAIGDATVI